MKFECLFKKMKKSKKVITFTQEHFERLNHFEMTITQVHVSISQHKHMRQVDAVVWCEDKPYKAIGMAENVYAAIDMAVAKLNRQLSKVHSRQSEKRKSFPQSLGMRLQSASTQNFNPRLFNQRRVAKAA